MTAATLTRSLRRVPLASLLFAGAMVSMNDQNFSAETDPATVEGTPEEVAAELDDDSAPPPPKPITIRARTSGVAYQGYWGRCVHDMAGFIPPTGPVPLDWNHCEEEDIGVAETFTIDPEGLLVAGRLIPFTSKDRAAQIIYKGQAGVPYQASIVLAIENLVITEVPEGITYEVNGQAFEGPLTVFSQWSIDGVSVLPYGADSGTSLQFSRGEAVEVDVTVQTPAPWKEPPPMSEPAKLPADALNFSRDEMQRWIQNFGADAIQWYVDGTAKSFEEAALLFGKNLRTQIEQQRTDFEAKLAERDQTISALTTERDALKAKTEFRRGHQTPAKVDPPAGTEPAKDGKGNPANFGRSPGMDAFVNAVAAKLPGQRQQ